METAQINGAALNSLVSLVSLATKPLATLGPSMPMFTRLLHLFVCLLLIGPLSTPGWATVRPENRFGGSSGFSSTFASPSASQVAESHQENTACVYDFASGVHKYLYAAANPVNMVDPSGHDFSFVGTLTALTTAEGLQTMKAAVDTRIQWSIRNMAKQIVNDVMPNDLNQQLGKEGEEVWERYLNKIPGFRVVRAKGSASAVGPDIYGIAPKNRRVVIFIGEVKASDGRLPGIGKLEWNVVNATRQMSANWIDNYASKAVEKFLEMGLEGLGLGEFKQLNRAGKIEVYLLGALRKFSGWTIRGYRMLHLGDDEVIPDTTEGGFPEITDERDVR